MAEQGTHKPLVVSSNLTLGTKQQMKVSSSFDGGLVSRDRHDFFKTQDWVIIEFLYRDYLPVWAETFPIDGNLTAHGIGSPTTPLLPSGALRKQPGSIQPMVVGSC